MMISNLESGGASGPEGRRKLAGGVSHRNPSRHESAPEGRQKIRHSIAIPRPLQIACALAVLCLFTFLYPLAAAPFDGWSQSGSIFLLTTPEGADLPVTAAVEQFPVLLRLQQESFDFSGAQAHGEDLRFATDGGESLPCQIESWNPAQGEAAVWVRVPKIIGNARQELRVLWGNPAAKSESSGSAVFNETNGFASVWHLGAEITDEVGTLESKDNGTTVVPGMIGEARHFAGKQGIFCGDKIANYPAGSSPHTTEAWFRAEVPNTTVLCWGHEGGPRGSKVRMMFRSPPHFMAESGFSNIESDTHLPMNEWIHVVHTYGDGPRRIYINGQVDTEATTKLEIPTPARLYLGGWYNNYDFMGDLDEVRISRVARTADWVRLTYENQKPLQTLAGTIVPTGDAFSLSESQLTVPEGKSATVTAQAGGAQKVYWLLRRNGHERVVATDRFNYRFDAGRVSADAAAVLVFKAVYPSEVKTKEVAITIKEALPEPVFALTAPAQWDGRTPMEIVPHLSNLAALQAAGVGDWKAEWVVTGLATVKSATPQKLALTRAQNSGILTVTATVSNGGAPSSQTVSIAVTEPASDLWVARVPARDEKPVEGQFYARDESGEGTLYYHGALGENAESVFLKLYAGDQLMKTVTGTPDAHKAFTLSAKLKPGLLKYKVEFGVQSAGRETVVETINNLVCGDAYLIDGQSNALATDTRGESPSETSEWIRSYGRPPREAKDAGENLWCYPVWKAQHGEKAELGWWGMELAKRLVASQQVPIFMINAAVGGTRIDMHQRNEEEPADLSTIYGRMLWRVQQAKLTHGIRGILWHQGENNQGAAGPDGDFDWKSYENYFVEMSAGWKRDFPNVQHTYVFQIWPNSCGMGGKTGGGDMIREIQRSLPRLYSHMSVMSTLGVRPAGGCHFPLAGWSEFARLIQPLIERDNYGLNPAGSITPPNLQRASFTGPAKDAVALQFDQPVVWSDALASQFYLGGEKGKVASGACSGNALTLKLIEPAAAAKITYLKESEWNQDNILMGANGIAALTFCEVPIGN